MALFTRFSAFTEKHAIRGTRATWLLFGIYAAVIFAIVIVSHWTIFHSIYISSLWKNPSVFFGFWMPKVCISLFLAFFVLLGKRKWWTVILLCFFDIWIIANILYYRANDYILTLPSIMMVSNLHGFESSIAFYWNWECSFCIILTVLYSICLPFLKIQKCDKGKAVTLLLIIILYIMGAEMNRRAYAANTYEAVRKTTYQTYIPFYIPQAIQDNVTNNVFVVDEQYLLTNSLIAYFPYIITSYFSERLSGDYTPTIDLLSNVINENTTYSITPTYNIVFVLVESFENFTLEITDKDGKHYLPNLHTLTQAANTLYVPKLSSQARHGGSADGQMTMNTGLLPIKNGTAAHLYNKNVYPNYAHFYDVATLSNPCTEKTWFQDILTYAYGYKQHLFCEEKQMRDAETFQLMESELARYKDSLFCYFALTVDSHSPFNRVAHNPSLRFDENMPLQMQQYLTCLHYTDSCFGVWYNEWKESEQAKNTILVITGDHTTFKSSILQDLMASYALTVDLSIANGKTYCPLIIQAPQIEENITLDEVCYQMDVYPTIMHLIGCEDYYWKGFGVNLLDSTARHNRPITEEEAYRLSDKLIRCNYFKQYTDSIAK